MQRYMRRSPGRVRYLPLPHGVSHGYTFAQLSGYGISVSGSTGTTFTGPAMYFYAAE